MVVGVLVVLVVVLAEEGPGVLVHEAVGPVVAEGVDDRDLTREADEREDVPARLEPVIIQDVAEAGDADDDGHDGAQEARGDAPARRDGVDVQAHA